MKRWLIALCTTGLLLTAATTAPAQYGYPDGSGGRPILRDLIRFGLGVAQDAIRDGQRRDWERRQRDAYRDWQEDQHRHSYPPTHLPPPYRHWDDDHRHDRDGYGQGYPYRDYGPRYDRVYDTPYGYPPRW